MDKTKFGTFIKEKRTERGYTQKALADLLTVDVTTVSKWERGVNYPDITMIPDICKYLEVSEHELIESSTDTKSREIAARARKFQKIKNAVFYSFLGCYLAAIAICFIVNLCSEHRLTWFFPAAAGCICGFTFIPGALRFFNRFHLPVYLASTWMSLTLLFTACSIYTKNYWFCVASAGVLTGYFAVFFPILAARQKKYLTEEKYNEIKRYFCLIYFGVLLVLTLLVILCVNIYNPSYNFMNGVKITVYCFLLPVLWGITELMPLKRMPKLGVDFILTGAHFYLLNGVLNSILGPNGIDYYRVDFRNWQECTNGNIAIVTLAVLTAAGAAMIITSIFKKIRNKKQGCRI